jgi:hypothetical protein
MVVIGEDYAYKPPTLAFCQSYAKQMGLPPEKTFIDSGPQLGGWEKLFTYIYPYPGAGGSLAFPWIGVLEGESMEYVFTSSDTPDHLKVLEALVKALKN